jgi:MFS family permease
MSTDVKKASWSVLIMLAAAQFIMVLDTTVMNVSISQVVEDLNTTVVGLQSAITIYTLVMASFMLLGGKLGDRWGAKRAFALGLVIYGLGSLTTALSPNLATLLVGWSLIEGLGAALVIPAIAALVVSTYEGKQRVLAYGVLGGVAGASAAAGPLIGGWVGTYYSWRYVFAGETVVVAGLMFLLFLIPKTPGKPGRLDLGGAALSIAGLGLGVFAILRSSQWGWILPGPKVPVINGNELTPLGLSPVVWLLILSSFLLTWFVRYEQRLVEKGREPLVDLSLLRIPPLRAGLIMMGAQQFIIMATFFVLPLYLQSVLGFDALKTGVAILPLSISLLVFALGGAALSGRLPVRTIVQAGIAAMLIGEIFMLAAIEVELRSVGFGIGLALVGAGLGLLASQLGNVIMSSAPKSKSGEAGGLQGTAQNLGASLGTALIGAVLIGVLSTTFATTIQEQPNLSAEIKQEASSALTASANFVTLDQVEEAATSAGLSEAETADVVAAYSEAQLASLRGSLAAIALFALLALAYVRRLPKRAPTGEFAKET